MEDGEGQGHFPAAAVKLEAGVERRAVGDRGGGRGRAGGIRDNWRRSAQRGRLLDKAVGWMLINYTNYTIRRSHWTFSSFTHLLPVIPISFSCFDFVLVAHFFSFKNLLSSLNLQEEEIMIKG